MAGLQTTAIHAGDLHEDTHAHVMPIYQTSTFTYDSIEQGQARWRGEEPGYIYSRVESPNTAATAKVIAALEGHGLDVPVFGLMTSSGMGAASVVTLALVKEGDTILAQHSLYGSTSTLFHQKMPPYGVHTDFFDGHDLNDLDAAIARNKNIRFIYVETPANPTLALTDITGVVERAHALGALAVIDNTFATPILQQPLAFGADIVLHSTTKYLTGHGTVVGGAIVTPHEALYRDHLLPTMRTFGFNESPMDAWLTYNGLKTLPLRMRQHCDNACQIAHYLKDHPAVSQVYYPGLPDFPQHELATCQMRDFGGMVSFELAGGYEAGVSLLNHLKLCALGVSLGTVDTLVQHPASMTHFLNPPEVRAAMGITDGLIRISVGIEDVEDLLADFEQAFEAVRVPASFG
ncbi:MAG: PLP-dependent aspartate aminotransferase family protein [Anaerolineae bacterium]|nr:PLP-dependent aspartate aminotransferase family protein [Anaerolineae bacterium]